MQSMISSRTNAYPIRDKIATLCLAAMPTACGGGDGTALPTMTASRLSNSEGPRGVDHAASGKIVARGPITALATLGINGVRDDDWTAAVRINGHERRIADLKLGMVVEVEAEGNASLQESVARTISTHSLAEGRVEAIDLVARTMTVMGITFEGVVAALGPGSFQMNGLTVRWDAQTRFDDLTSGAIQLGTQLEVRAIWSGSEYVATRIKGED